MPTEVRKSCILEEDLKKHLHGVMNEPLPLENRSLFQISIGKTCVNISSGNFYPV